MRKDNSEQEKNTTSLLPYKRSDWLIQEGVHYLNHGAYGAVPRVVFNAFQEQQQALELAPANFFEYEGLDRLNKVREALASHFGASAENLALVQNTTHGLNVIARSLVNRLPLGTDDEVLLMSEEYGAVQNLFHSMASLSGCGITFVPLLSPQISTEEIASVIISAITPKTRVVVFDHITSTTCRRLPVETLCQELRSRNILSVIDGAHAPGLLDLNLEGIDADFYCANLHKWFSCPRGTAFLHIRKSAHHLIEPLIIGWACSPGAVSTDFRNLIEWQGTRDHAAFLSIPSAIDFWKAMPLAELQQEAKQLLGILQKEYLNLLGLAPPADPELPEVQMLPLPVPPTLIALGMDATGFKTYLRNEHQVYVSAPKLKGSQLIRASIQAYNSREDINALLRGVDSCLRLHGLRS